MCREAGLGSLPLRRPRARRLLLWHIYLPEAMAVSARPARAPRGPGRLRPRLVADEGRDFRRGDGRTPCGSLRGSLGWEGSCRERLQSSVSRWVDDIQDALRLGGCSLRKVLRHWGILEEGLHCRDVSSSRRSSGKTQVGRSPRRNFSDLRKILF